MKSRSISSFAVVLPLALALSVRLASATCAPPDAVPLSDCVGDPGADVTIGGSAPGCEQVYVDRSFTSSSGAALGRVTIESDGSLVLADATVASLGGVALETTGFEVSGTLEMGNATCPIGTTDPTTTATITFTGARPCPSPEECPGRHKGIEVPAGGTLRLFGAKGVPPQGVTWTHLRQPSGPETYSAARGVKAPVPNGGATTLWLADDVQAGPSPWRAGDWIAVATTSFSPFETEMVQIKGITPHPEGSRVLLEQPLRFYHFGSDDPGVPSAANFEAGPETNYGVDERAEVALLSRNLKLTSTSPAGDEGSRHWGGELRFLKGFAEVSVQGVELEKFGKDQLGSYPIHFHMAQSVANAPLVNANSVHHSFNKCVTVHDTNDLTVTNNVCARIVGHIFYQEIGTESGIRFERNLGMGAMSNGFDVNAADDAKRRELIDTYWWPGDHLTNDPASPDFIAYDGLRVPNTDAQSNPTHGSCWTTSPDGGLTYASEVPCAAGQLYTEPASGFWIIHPGTELVGNSIAGCQGVGRGYWYVPPQGGGLETLKFEPIGEFRNNRVHGCYAGLYNEPEYSVRSEQLFPHENAAFEGRPIIGRFEGLTATRNRFRGIWMRPVWFVVKHARLATNRENATLVSSGGLDGNAPGVWALIEDTVIVGLSENNVDRFGPCPYPGTPVPGTGGFVGCIDRTPGPAGRVGGGDEIGQGYPDPHWNISGVMIYDGPVLIFDDRFVNFHIDLGRHLTDDDRERLDAYRYPNGTNVYEGDAALGWFQSNQSSYPTATASRGLTWDHVDLRHQIYTEGVNLGPFKDGDKNTALLDLDGSLTGYVVVDENGDRIHDAFAISLNNLMFNASEGSVDECLAEGAQDTVVEDRPTSLISPGHYATLELSALFPKPDDVSQHWQDLTFAKSSTEFGKHPTMTLESRNGLGVWEPKVASGYGYTVEAHPASGRTEAGLPRTVTVGVLDVVKPDVSETNPFHVRLGLCYTSADPGQPHPAGTAPFEITRGYKSYGGGNVDRRDPLLQQYWNWLENRYEGQVCINLDDPNRRNLDPVTGCPANGVTAVPPGGCPAPSVEATDADGAPACIYPKETLQPAASIDELTRPDGSPEVDKYFYDAERGLLFLNVVQDLPNPVGPSPLGSCTGGANDDPACPDVADGETYYACPAPGCQTYRIEVTDPSYVPAPSNCGSPYPQYEMEEPERKLFLKDITTGEIVERDPEGARTRFPHYAPDRWPKGCSLEENTAPRDAPSGPVGLGGLVPGG